MRPEARLKAGYFPAPPAAIDCLLPHLRLPLEGEVAILDPCAGEGLALKQIADGLRSERGTVPHDRLWLIELDHGRGESCRRNLPDTPATNILSPASFLQTSIRGDAFSMIYCNPPFDDSAAAGVRVEELFLKGLHWLLAKDGVLVFVAPENVIHRPGFKQLLLPRYDQITVIPWPDEVCEYGEVFLVARAAEYEKDRTWSAATMLGPQRYRLPKAPGPGKRFHKTDFTDDEIDLLLDQSPLKDHLRIVPDHRLPTPPLALGVGHLALLLASGQLDGLVTREGEPPHVVRGTAKKVKELTDQTVDEQTVDETKSQTVTTSTWTERICLEIRAVWPDGEIITLGEEGVTDVPTL